MKPRLLGLAVLLLGLSVFVKGVVGEKAGLQENQSSHKFSVDGGFEGKDDPLSKDKFSTDTPIPSPSSSPIPSPSSSPIPSPSSTPAPSPSTEPSTSPLPSVEDLMKELAALRQRVAELEAGGAGSDALFSPELARLVAAGVPHSAAAFLPESVYAAIQKTVEECHDDAVNLCGAPERLTDVGLPMDRFPSVSMCFERFTHSMEVSSGCKDAARSIVSAVQSIPDVNLFVAGSRAVLSESYSAFMTDCLTEIQTACSVDETSLGPQLPSGYGDDTMTMQHDRHHGGMHHGRPYHGGLHHGRPHNGGPDRRRMELLHKYHKHRHMMKHRQTMEKLHNVNNNHGHGHPMWSKIRHPVHHHVRRLHKHHDDDERKEHHGYPHRSFHHGKPAEKSSEDLPEHSYDTWSTTHQSNAPEGVTPELSYCIKKIVAWSPSQGTCRRAAQNIAVIGSRIYDFDFVNSQSLDSDDWEHEDNDDCWHGHHWWHHDHHDHHHGGGAFLVLILVGVAVFCCVRRRRILKAQRRIQRNRSAATDIIGRSTEAEAKANAPSTPVHATAPFVNGSTASVPVPTRAQAVPPVIPNARMPIAMAATAPVQRTPVAYSSIPTSYSMLPRHLQQLTYPMPVTGQAPQYVQQQQQQQQQQQ